MVYDKVYNLVDDIKESDDYKEYISAKEEAFQDETTRALLKQYRKLYVQATSYYVSQTEPPEELSNEIISLNSLLSLNPAAVAFLNAERKINEVMGEIFSIVSKSIDISLDFMN